MSKAKELFLAFLAWCKQLAYQPIYPVLFSIYPILFLYQHNIAELTIDVMYVPILAAIVAASLLLLIFYMFYKDWSKSALLSGVLIAYFFFADSIVDLLPLHLFQLGFVDITRGMIMKPALFVALLATTYILWRATSQLPRLLTRPLNIVVVALILLAGIPIIPIEYQRLASDESGVNSSLKQATINLAANSVQSYKPDVYYLIFDKYANNASLQDYYGFNNESFHGELRDRGFYVADKSRTNYPSTVFSMSSSLNMNYIQELVDMSDPSLSVGTTLHDLFTNNSVGQLFEKNGYTYYHLGNWYDPTRRVDIADKNLLLEDTAKGHNFVVKLLEPTLLSHFASISGIAPVGTTSHSQREILNFQFDAIKQIPKDSTPTFTVMHALLPHDPFVFDGNCVDIPILGAAYSSPSDYVNHVKCTNIKALAAVDYILKNSAEPPVIIIQSDEGSRQYVDGKENVKLYAFEGAPDAYWLERTGIQNAYYFPDLDYSKLYESISPVNSFRIVFNKYLGYSLDLKEDRHYVFPDLDHMFNFIDATDKLEHLDTQAIGARAR